MMYPEISGMALRGYQQVLPYGFAIPIFGVGPRPNSWYRARCWPPRNRKGRILGFIPDDPQNLEVLPPELVAAAEIDGPWLNVFLWEDRKFTGPAASIWRETKPVRTAIRSSAPVTMLALSECGPLPVYKEQVKTIANWARDELGSKLSDSWRNEVLLRSALIRDLRRFIGVERDKDPHFRSALGGLTLKTKKNLLVAEIESAALHGALAGYRPKEHFKVILDVLQLAPRTMITRRQAPQQQAEKFDQRKAEDMIERGELPPPDWRPLVANLDLRFFKHFHLLPYFPNLVSLNIYRGDFDDIQPISKLEQLRSVRIEASKPFSLDPLRFANKLEILSFRDTPVRDISPLTSLSNLIEVDLMNAFITDISALADKKSLISLNLTGTNVSNIESLSTCERLQTLVLWCTEVNDLKPIMRLHNLSSLNIRNTNVVDIGPLRGLRRLKRLDAKGAKISDIGPLKDLAKLEYLALGAAPIRDFSPLSNLKRLKYLYAANTFMTDLGFLLDFKSLVALDIKNTKVENIDALSDLITLKFVNLSGTAVAIDDALRRVRSELVVLPDESEGRMSRQGRLIRRRRGGSMKRFEVNLEAEQ